MKVAITGANGHLGVACIRAIGVENSKAIVRSESAKADLLNLYPDIKICVADYNSETALNDALSGADLVLHLVGIIKESSKNRYKTAHEDSCHTLLSACPASVKRIIYLSILGSRPDSNNACLASKGRAEKLLLDHPLPVTIIQIPMVLGENDYASRALRKQASARVALTFRSASLEQPIYAGDVIAAIQSVIASAMEEAGSSLDDQYRLAGEVSLSRKALIQQAGRLLDNSVTVISIPLFIGICVAWLLERSDDPPITRAMLGVLDHDDEVDVSGAIEALGISLTSLDETLSRVLRK